MNPTSNKTPNQKEPPKADTTPANETKPPQNGVSKSIIIALISAILILLLLGVGTYFLLMRSEDKATGLIRLDDVDPAIVEQISDQLVYNTKDGVSDYYSPELDGVLKYDADSIYLTEGSNYIILSPREDSFGQETLSVQMGFSEKSLGEALNSQSEYLKSVYVDAAQFESNTENYGADTQSFSYSYKRVNFLTKESEVLYNTYVVKEIDGKTFYLDFKAYKDKEQHDRDIQTYINIYNSFSTDLSNLEQSIGYTLSDVVTVDFDREKWKLTSSSDTILSLNFRSSEYEEKKDEYFYDSTFVNISTLPSSIERDKEYFAQAFENDLNYLKETYDNVEELSPPSEVDINGEMYYVHEYRYDSYSGNSNYVKRYESYNVANELTISARITTSSIESNGYPEAQEVVNSITVVDSEEEASLIRQLISSSNDTGYVLGSNSLEIQKAAVLGEPAVLRIFNRSCVDIKFDSSSGLSRASNKTYTQCSAGFGSGFYINNDGYIITNAHVATPNTTDLVITSMVSQSDSSLLFNDLGTDVAEYLLDEYPNLARYPDEASEYILLGMVSAIADGLEKGYAEISNVRYENFVQDGSPFAIDSSDYSLSNSTEHLSTELIDYNELQSKYEFIVSEDSEGEEFKINTPDIALIKVTNSKQKNLPVIKLSDPSQITSGNQVHVIGYPGVANNSSLFSASSDQIATITVGNISAIKPSSDNSFKLIQIDASISNGNSGGPILNADGELVAVATYGLGGGEESGDFNVGVSVEEVQKILKTNNVTASQSSVSVKVESGLDNLSLNYYKWAVEDFNESKSLNQELTPVLDPLIKAANDKIASGEDQTPLFAFASITISTQQVAIFGAIGVVFFILLVVIFVLFIKAIKQKKGSKKSNTTQLPKDDSQPPAPVQQDLTSPVQHPYQANSQAQEAEIEPIQEQTQPAQPEQQELVQAQMEPIQEDLQPVQPQIIQEPVQPVQPQIVQEPVQPVQPQIIQEPVQPVQPQMVQEPVQPVQPQIIQEPVQPVQPQMVQEPVQPVQPQIVQEPVQPVQPQMVQEPVQPVQPQLVQEPVQSVQPQLVQEPIQPVQPQLVQEPVQPVQQSQDNGTQNPGMNRMK
jgi:S1-C subfamily serine protease